MMNKIQTKYDLISACIDDWEPLCIVLNRETYLRDSDLLVDLVNNDNILCKQDSKPIESLTRYDVLVNLKLIPYWDNLDVPFETLNWGWNESYLFKASEKGVEYAVALFESAKQRTLQIARQIAIYHRANGKYPELHAIKGLSVSKPYDSFGDWIYCKKEGACIVGFSDYDGAIEYYGYDICAEKWEWRSL